MVVLFLTTLLPEFMVLPSLKKSNWQIGKNSKRKQLPEITATSERHKDCFSSTPTLLGPPFSFLMVLVSTTASWPLSRYLVIHFMPFEILTSALQAEYHKRGFTEVVTPNMFNKVLWETSGHWQNYKESILLTPLSHHSCTRANFPLYPPHRFDKLKICSLSTATIRSSP